LFGILGYSRLIFATADSKTSDGYAFKCFSALLELTAVCTVLEACAKQGPQTDLHHVGDISQAAMRGDEWEQWVLWSDGACTLGLAADGCILNTV